MNARLADRPIGHSISQDMQSNLLLKDAFRNEFEKAFSICIRKRFSGAECFGVIWEETLESYELPEAEQVEMYHKLIAWAKKFTGGDSFAESDEYLMARSPNNGANRFLTEA